MTNQNKLDFLAVGDVFNDYFIELEQATVNCDANGEHCMLSMPFGDKLPYKGSILVRAVGNAGNASVSASRMGLSSALLAITGNDDDGEQIFKQLAVEKVSEIFMKKDPQLSTNNAYVLRYQAERTILVKQEEYSYTVDNELLESNAPGWIYFTSIHHGALQFHHDLVAWVEAHPNTKLVFQPGTFQLQLGKEKLADVYRATHLFFCNKEEAQLILGDNTDDLHVLIDKMHALGPKLVCITDGPKGAYASDGSSKYFMPIYPDPKPPFERTGAGDAFSSMFTVALAMRESFETALKWAPINSMNVVQYVGAQKGLLTKEKLMEWLSKAPADYQPKKI